jgi:hypothetical protein
VVDETVQNVWTADIPDVLRWNKTCMICSGIVFGVSELYSKVELVNAFRINSSLKWSKINSNRVSNIISECSKKYPAMNTSKYFHKSFVFQPQSPRFRRHVDLHLIVTMMGFHTAISRQMKPFNVTIK